MRQNAESQEYLEKFNLSIKRTRDSILSISSPKRPFLQWLTTSRIALETIKDYAAHKKTKQNELIKRLNSLTTNYTELEKYIDW